MPKLSGCIWEILIWAVDAPESQLPGSTVVQSVVPLARYSTMYCATAEPCVLVGAVHEAVSCPSPPLSVTAVGAEGCPTTALALMGVLYSVSVRARISTQ